MVGEPVPCHGRLGAKASKAVWPMTLVLLKIEGVRRDFSVQINTIGARERWALDPDSVGPTIRAWVETSRNDGVRLTWCRLRVGASASPPPSWRKPSVPRRCATRTLRLLSFPPLRLETFVSA